MASLNTMYAIDESDKNALNMPLVYQEDLIEPSAETQRLLTQANDYQTPYRDARTTIYNEAQGNINTNSAYLHPTNTSSIYPETVYLDPSPTTTIRSLGGLNQPEFGEGMPRNAFGGNIIHDVGQPQDTNSLQNAYSLSSRNISKKRGSQGSNSPRLMKRQRGEGQFERPIDVAPTHTPQAVIPGGLTAEGMMKVLTYAAAKFNKPPKVTHKFLADGTVIGEYSFSNFQAYLDQFERLKTPEPDEVEDATSNVAKGCSQLQHEKAKLAERYCSYQPTRTKHSASSSEEGRYRCISGHHCHWSHNSRTTWRSHEYQHYPSVIYVCPKLPCHQQDEHKWIFLRKDLLIRHLETWHTKLSLKTFHSEQHTIPITNSKFPKSCVFVGCDQRFTTMKERLHHCGRHLEDGHALDGNKLEKLANEHQDRHEEEDSDDDSELDGFHDGKNPDLDLNEADGDEVGPGQGDSTSEAGPSSFDASSTRRTRSAQRCVQTAKNNEFQMPHSDLKDLRKNRGLVTKFLVILRHAMQFVHPHLAIGITHCFHSENESATRFHTLLRDLRPIFSAELRLTSDFSATVSAVENLLDFVPGSMKAKNNCEHLRSVKAFGPKTLCKHIETRGPERQIRRILNALVDQRIDEPFSQFFSVNKSVCTKLGVQISSSSISQIRICISYVNDITFETGHLFLRCPQNSSRVSKHAEGIVKEPIKESAYLRKRKLIATEPQSGQSHKKQFVYGENGSHTGVGKERPSTAWTSEEDMLLWHLRYNKIAWNDIAVRFSGKTANACRKRHKRLLHQPQKTFSSIVDTGSTLCFYNAPKSSGVNLTAELQQGCQLNRWITSEIAEVEIPFSPSSQSQSRTSSTLSSSSRLSFEEISSGPPLEMMEPDMEAPMPFFDDWSSPASSRLLPGQACTYTPTRTSSMADYESLLLGNIYGQSHHLGDLRENLTEDWVLPVFSRKSGTDRRGLKIGY